MSYLIGTDVGRVRELVGDTDAENEIYPDAYYEDLLTRLSIGMAAAAALRRMRSDPSALLRKYHGFGNVTIDDIAQLKRLIDEEIKDLEASASAITEASAPDSCTPEPNQTDVGASTDENGWYKQSDIGNYLAS